VTQPVRMSSRRSPHRDRLLEAVAEVADVLAAGADTGEAADRLPRSSVDALRSSGLFAALAPVEVGGFQVDPVTELELIEAVSAIDPSTGWSFWASAGSTARVASMLPDDAAAEIFAGGDPSGLPLFAFQERPFGNTVRPTAEGLHVSGTWPFGTGVDYADWVVAVGAIEPAAAVAPATRDGSRTLPAGEGLLAAAVPTSQVTVLHDSWDAPGLRGTGTFTYRISNVVVPWHRVWEYPPDTPRRGGPFFCFRRAPIKHAGFALGLASGFLSGFTQHVASRATAGRAPAGALVAELARAHLQLDAARALALDTVGSVWEEALAAGALTPFSQARLRAVARYITEVAIDVCGLLTRHGDARLLVRHNRLHRALRDVAAAAAHAEVSADALGHFGALLAPKPADIPPGDRREPPGDEGAG
jgi:indole-3-acetate monooxygenase